MVTHEFDTLYSALKSSSKEINNLSGYTKIYI